ncbi:hypothetical protein E4T56_gene18880 [Termitomyces sp. T112]|nr:hypothetical protein E4T56_gene18880 [Termitomyces sp. T112]
MVSSPVELWYIARLPFLAERTVVACAASTSVVVHGCHHELILIAGTRFIQHYLHIRSHQVQRVLTRMVLSSTSSNIVDADNFPKKSPSVTIQHHKKRHDPRNGTDFGSHTDSASSRGAVTTGLHLSKLVPHRNSPRPSSSAAPGDTTISAITINSHPVLSSISSSSTVIASFPSPVPLVVAPSPPAPSATSTPMTLAPSSTTPDPGSAKGFFQNTDAVATTFTTVGLTILAIFIFIVIFIVRRRRQTRSNGKSDGATAESANASALTLVDDRHRGQQSMYYDMGSNGMYAPRSTSQETYGLNEPGYGFSDMGAGYQAQEFNGWTGKLTSTTTSTITPSRHTSFNTSASDFRSSYSTFCFNPSTSRRSTKKQRYYRQLLKAVGLARASGSSTFTDACFDPHKMQRGMSLNRNAELEVLPNPHDVPGAQAQQGGTALGTDNSPGGEEIYYVVEERLRLSNIAKE